MLNNKDKKPNKKVTPAPDHGPVLEHILEATHKGGKERAAIAENHLQAHSQTNTLLQNEVEASGRILKEVTELNQKFHPEEIGDGKEFIVKGVKGDKGDKGDSPTGEELLKLIKPLIPIVKNGEDGHTPTNKELIALIKPFIPEVEDGKTPTKKELLALIRPIIQAIKIPIPKDGKPGAPGKDGKTPKLSIKKLLELLKGKLSYDDLKNLPNLDTFRKQSSKTTSLSELDDVNLSGLSRDANGKYQLGSGSGGGSLAAETPTGLVNDSNTIFTVANEPFYINVNGAIYSVGDGAYASYLAGQITLAYPVGSGGFIKSYYQ